MEKKKSINSLNIGKHNNTTDWNKFLVITQLARSLI